MDAVPELAGHTGYLLSRAFRRAQEYGVRALPDGRSRRELIVLAALRHLSPVSQRRLGDLLGVNRTIMVKLVDGMVADGLVVRERDAADQRNYALRLSAAGLALLDANTGVIHRTEHEVTEALDDAERARLASLLGRMLPDLVSNLPADLTTLCSFLLTHAHQRLRQEATERFDHLDLAPAQVGLITTLAAIQPCSQSELADRLGVTAPAIVAAIQNLESSGLIEREREPADRRRLQVRLTDRGRAELAEATAISEDIDRRVAEQVGPGDLAELNRLLGKLVG